MPRAVVLVLDGVGVGELPDAARYGDEGTNTLLHAAEAAGPLRTPRLAELGLGCIQPAPGLLPARAPTGSFGRMRERSADKDTQSGHFELMGCAVAQPYTHFSGGFPAEILDPFCRAAGVTRVLGNRAASGTKILDELGPEHERTGLPIVYTSADSVFQVAAHEEVVPVETLYRWCEAARAILDPYRVGRVIARPFVGSAGRYVRTFRRRDYAMPPPGPTLLDELARRGVPVIGVGKIEDIFSGRGITEAIHTEGNRDGMRRTAERLARLDHGFVFTNLVEFDSHYGHRRDPAGMVRALGELDADLAPVLAELRAGDLLVLTADHGNDPTFTKTTDHTREHVPLLVYEPGKRGRDLGIRESFCDVGATVGAALGVPAPAGRPA
ncbi:MAG TPA: phosphopentomutase [Planctomycetota bacterium]|nr:phosphopentomutase [Planctomycetota bacterium]